MGLLCCFLPNKIKTCCHVLGFGFLSFLTVDLFLTEGKKFPGCGPVRREVRLERWENLQQADTLTS